MQDYQLYYFSTLYKDRNAQSAAGKIPLSRQGLIKSLVGLENELGVKLFDDLKAPYCTPTVYGDIFFEFVSSVLKDYARLKHEFSHLKKLEEGVIHVCAAIGINSNFAAKVFQKFEKDYPEARIIVDEMSDFQCDEKLLSNDFSLGFTAFPYNDSFETIQLYETERYIWLNKNNPLAQKEVLHLQDIKDLNIGIIGVSFKNYTDLIKLAEKDEVSLRHIETIAEMSALYNYASKKNNCSFTIPSVDWIFQELFVDTEAPNALIPFDSLPWKFGISWLKDRTLTQIEKQFVDYCIKNIRGAKQ